jgi:hypothetical protein
VLGSRAAARGAAWVTVSAGQGGGGGAEAGRGVKRTEQSGVWWDISEVVAVARRSGGGIRCGGGWSKTRRGKEVGW